MSKRSLAILAYPLFYQYAWGGHKTQFGRSIMSYECKANDGLILPLEACYNSPNRFQILSCQRLFPQVLMNPSDHMTLFFEFINLLVFLCKIARSANSIVFVKWIIKEAILQCRDIYFKIMHLHTLNLRTIQFWNAKPCKFHFGWIWDTRLMLKGLFRTSINNYISRINKLRQQQ